VKTNFFQTYLNLVKSNLFLTLLLCILSTLTFPLIINSVFIVLLLLATLLNINKLSIKKNSFSDYAFFLFFAWLTLSFIWTINKEDTFNAIIRQTSFFIFPLSFLVFQKNYLTVVSKWFSYSMFIIALYFILRAIARFFILKNTSVFFFHGEYTSDLGLVPKELNAVYVGAFSSLAFIYFLIKQTKSKLDYFIVVLLLVFIFMLNVNAILFSTAVLVGIYFSFYSKTSNRMRLRNLILIISILISSLFYKTINNFFIHEFKTNTSKGIGHDVISGLPSEKHKVTIYEAWNNKTFSPNDFFPGTAFRVYQARLFFEFLKEESIFLKGFGLNASYQKIEEKGIKYNVFLGNEYKEGYQKKNFHNQYVQVFAELGLIGFVFFLIILFINIKNAFQSKNFMHIAFAILMISLFLTESFLWRQRGVVFFTLFYCLFNYNKKEEN